MAYDEILAARVRRALAARNGVTEKRFFGGVTFLYRGNMAVGVINCDLVVRVGPDDYDAMVAQPHARPMDYTGKPLKGFVYVASAGCKTTPALARWVERGLDYAGSLKSKA